MVIVGSLSFHVVIRVVEHAPVSRRRQSAQIAAMQRFHAHGAVHGRWRLTSHPHQFRGRCPGRACSMHSDGPKLSRSEPVMNTHGKWILAAAAALSLCALAGCNQRESTQETATDVAEARQDANENVAEERREAADAAVEGSMERAAAEYDVAVAQADGQRKVAKEKCETLPSDAQQACKDQADATYELAKSQAQATLDAARSAGSANPPAN
jgi:outer membrane murein-binding lipoprotein Lpp